MTSNKYKNGFYTSVWCTKDEVLFRSKIPLELLGESLVRYKSSFSIKVIVMEGYCKLSLDYLHKLNSLGFEILDYEETFNEVLERFPNLNAFYSHYERNCFLRWVVFKEIIKSEPNIKQFWHLDSDVILHTSLDEISSDTAGKTFMLEGCPVLTSVSDFDWFTTYETELFKLENDIIGYSQKAASIKDFCQKNDFLLCNQSLYRNPVGSDQDLLEYLISSKTIKQDESSVIFNSSFYFTQNPLSFSFWNKLQGNMGLQENVRGDANKEIWYGAKKVPFIHYQGTFCNFANVYVILFKLRLLKFSKIRRILDFEIKQTNLLTSKTFRLVVKLISLSGLKLTREMLIKFLLDYDKNTDQMHIIGLLNLINKKHENIN